MKKPIVFCDFHHAGLLQSFILLFEKRFGGEVYRPIGMDWATQGFWKIYDHPATQEQFLSVGGATPDNTPKLNEVLGVRPITDIDYPTVYICKDIDSNFTNKAITFDGFMNLKIDIVIASIPQHIEPFKRLCELHPNKPKLIFQIGNAWSIEANGAKNIMASAIVEDVPKDVANFITYHQEFDLDIFKPAYPYGNYEEPNPHISSFVNCFNISDHFVQDWELFQKVEKLMPSWHFKSFGGQCRDGAAHGNEMVADFMRTSRFIWHTKNGGDGYGHIVFNTAAVARPCIVKKEYYRGKLAEKLFIDGETCIAIDNLNPQEIVNKIEYYNETDRYYKMCQNVYNNFKDKVNFDTEAQQISDFIDKLV